VPSAAVEVPPQANFGHVKVGSSRNRTIRVTNTGTVTVNIASASITPPGSPFAIVDDSCSGTALPVDGQCQITVSFSPTDAGSAEATLTITDDAGQQTVDLRGSGRLEHSASDKKSARKKRHHG
jgi:ASPM-SPD-2-Hydin domain-containing protein